MSNTMDESAMGGPEEDFTEHPESPARRAFMRAGIGVVGACYAAALGYPVYRYLASPATHAAALGAITEVAIAKAQIPPPGSVLTFMFGPRPAMLIHHEDGSLVCFDSVCTHLGCTVAFQPEQKRIFCQCHGGEYDMHTGSNVAGPPPRPLKQYTVEDANEQLIIRRA